MEPLRAVDGTAPVAAPDPATRRMVVVAALGADEGDWARRSIARWWLSHGRRAALVDIGCETAPADPAACPDPVAAERPRVPLVRLPAAPERLRDQPAELLAALLDRLRRHECSTDLIVTRIAPRFRMALMRAAFLAGGLVVPIENRYDVLYEAFRISREALESFLDLSLWPLPRDETSLRRFQAMMRDVLDVDAAPLNERDEPAAGLIDRLAAPPEEGFLVSLVDPDTPAPPAQLLQIGSLTL
jgi:hypothetical protein